MLEASDQSNRGQHSMSAKYLYTVYQTTNNVNGKIYIGVHKTLDPNDNYLGSGIALKQAIEKYSKENFTKEILYTYKHKKFAYNKENELVNEEFINRNDTYNLIIGGQGGGTPISTNKIVTQFKDIHGDKYDYSLVEYINAHSKIKIKCSVHGIFEQTSDNHKNGQGCPKCNGKFLTNEERILEYNQVHNFKYGYSKMDYVKNNIKIEIICPTHGSFEQSPIKHKSGAGCPKCSGKGLTNEERIFEYNQIHNNKFDYTKAYYINAKTKIEIICNTHGSFWQIPNDHKNGYGCRKCAIDKRKKI